MLMIILLQVMRFSLNLFDVFLINFVCIRILFVMIKCESGKTCQYDEISFFAICSDNGWTELPRGEVKVGEYY